MLQGVFVFEAVEEDVIKAVFVIVCVIVGVLDISGDCESIGEVVTDLVTNRGLTVAALDTQYVRDRAGATVVDAEVVEVRLTVIDRVPVGQDVDVLDWVLERVVVLDIGGVDVLLTVAAIVAVAFVVLDMGGEDVAVLELVVVRDADELAVDDLEAVIDDVVVLVTS